MTSKSFSFRNLREFTNALPSSDDAHKLFHELLNDPNDRASGIAGAAYLEASLEEALAFRLRKIGAKDCDEIFRGDAPLGTFSAKIKFASCLGLFGPRTRDDFNHIREVRNAFAHSKLKADFETPEIHSVCWRIQFPKLNRSPHGLKPEQLGHTRVRFAWTCTIYTEILAEIAKPGNHQISKRWLGT
jgi:hypothetical protein